MSTCYLILGTPRSGTTLVASIVHALGVPMGETFTEGLPDWGPTHFYADEDCQSCCTALWRGDFRPVSEAHPDAITELRQLVTAREAAYPRWGVKVFGLPFCLPLLVPMLADPRFIVCTRRRESSVASWRARREPHSDPVEADMVIDTHTDAIAAALARWPGPTLALDFDAIFAGPPQRIVDSLATFLGVPSQPDAARLVDPEWRRF